MCMPTLPLEINETKGGKKVANYCDESFCYLWLHCTQTSAQLDLFRTRFNKKTVYMRLGCLHWFKDCTSVLRMKLLDKGMGSSEE